MGIVQSIFLFVRAFILGRAAAAIENLALRQQVAVFKQSVTHSIYGGNHVRFRSH